MITVFLFPTGSSANAWFRLIDLKISKKSPRFQRDEIHWVYEAQSICELFSRYLELRSFIQGNLVLQKKWKSSLRPFDINSKKVLNIICWSSILSKKRKESTEKKSRNLGGEKARSDVWWLLDESRGDKSEDDGVGCWPICSVHRTNRFPTDMYGIWDEKR